MTAIGVKGSDVYTAAGVQDERVALSALLTRGVTSETIKPLIDAIIAKNDTTQLEDLFVLAFQTRDVRGGKGEREAFRLFYGALLANPKTCPIAMDLLDLVPEYGSWRDLFIEAVVPSLPYQSEPEMRERIVEIVKAQWVKDQAADCCAPISLMAKWMPRENRNKYLAGLLAGRLFPDRTGPTQYSSQMRLYRKAVAFLNRRIQTTEIAMSGGHWETIEPSKVPGRCLQKHMKAFLNEIGTTKKGEQPPRGHPLRHPEDPDRMACREHFQEHFKKAATGEGGAKVNGSKTVFPHELIKKAISLDESAVDERNAILAVWRQMVADAKAGGGLGRSIAMCDFSGSMQSSGSNGSTPYWVSMALGLLISEVTTEEFQNTFLTFDSQPTMHTMRTEDDLFERLKHIGRLGQGLSTDFQKAMDLVLGQLKAKRCRPGQEPENLIVLTDMNWDQACGSHQQSVYTGNGYRNVVKTSAWQTHVEMIREAFKRAGEDMWGEGQGLTMPRIVIWNIASSSTDFHAQSDTEGVAMLSGWSPSLFKALQTQGPDGVKPTTPMEMLRAQLDVERYDQVVLRVRSAMGNDMPLLSR
jgi:hypothetical protein